MEERSLRVLEFNKIRDLLVENARSDMGKDLCRALTPSSDRATVEAWQNETEEAVVILHRVGAHPIPAFDDVRAQLKRAELGAVLSMRDLLLCASAMRSSRTAYAALAREDDDEEDPTPRIHASAASLRTMRLLEEDIAGAILSDEEMSDGASPALASIRRKVRQANDRVREKLNSYIRNPSFQKYLQDPIITVRSGRFVLPVRQEHRQSVPGLIHDQSSSGATLFVEPMAIVEINNDIKQFAAQELAEIERILAEFSSRVAAVAADLATNLEILAHLDFLFAKGVLSRDMRASQPKLNEEGRLRLKRARHPLIAAAAVVPIDLWLGEEFSTLVVTGPNTGGKTVTLKTVGLLALMAQAGLQLPCDLGSETAVFDNVFADIGDEQSIEQSLSTFSSHMTNIVHILKNVTPHSLALFDELGAGTDPTEGAALAIAILERLRNRKIRTLATTHYAEIKAFALMNEGVENASVEFNIETLRPTYKLSIGIPGKSNAFEISRRLGLMEDIIAQATRRLSTEQIKFEDVISTAEAQRQRAQKERELAEEARVETDKLRADAEKMRTSMEAQRQEYLRKARDEAKQLVRRAQAEMDEAIDALKKADAEGQQRAVQQARQAMRDSMSALSEGLLEEEMQRLTPPPKDLKPGETVFIQHLGTNGTVLAPPNEKGEVPLQVGIMKATAHISQLRVAQESKPDKARARAQRQINVSQRSAALSCDVRGQSLGEAIENVDKYLDDCVLSSLTEVQIVHGKGTGTLRQGLHQHLRRHAHVDSFRLGKYGEGEEGVTVVTLRQ